MNIRTGLAATLAAGLLLVGAGVGHAAEPSVAERSIGELQADMTAGRTTSEALVRTYLDRIAAMDRAGPHLNSIIALNPDALVQARALDAERRAGHVRGPLHGVPILVKDNIETKDPVATTAGSLALAGNLTGRDAPVIARLRASGAVILGKTNLSEWANIRSTHATSGWSAVGGLVKNPYALDRNACGSSSGSGAAVAAGLAVAAVGTETDGSVTCPSSINGLVGLKPTVGLVSRTHIVPISASQDTAGPMARNVEEAALLLTVMAGSDPADPATREADSHKTNYVAALSPNALKGKRLGIMRTDMGYNPAVDALFAKAVENLRAAGAEVVEIKDYKAPDDLGKDELDVLLTELKVGLADYLSTAAPAVKTRTLADLIAFNTAHADTELRYFDQDLFEKAEATKGLSDPAYIKARADSLRAAGRDGIDKLLADNRLDALIAPTVSPAWTSDLLNGDHVTGSTGSLAAIAGYPHLTVPMGQVHGLPVGLSFMGPAWSEAKMLGMGYAFEQATHARKAPTYAASIP